jgi:hypothetical protein
MSNSFSLFQKKIELHLTPVHASISVSKQAKQIQINDDFHKRSFPQSCEHFPQRRTKRRTQRTQRRAKKRTQTQRTQHLYPVDRIDMVAKTNVRGECYNKVFIHFKAWNKKNPTAQATRDKLLKGEEVKIVYNEPWFWKCTESRVDKPEFRDYSAPPPRIDLGGCKSLSAADVKNEDAKNEDDVAKNEDDVAKNEDAKNE